MGEVTRVTWWPSPRRREGLQGCRVPNGLRHCVAEKGFVPAKLQAVVAAARYDVRLTPHASAANIKWNGTSALPCDHNMMHRDVKHSTISGACLSRLCSQAEKRLRRGYKKQVTSSIIPKPIHPLQQNTEQHTSHMSLGKAAFTARRQHSQSNRNILADG